MEKNDIEFLNSHKKTLDLIFKCQTAELNSYLLNLSEEYRTQILCKRDKDGNSIFSLAVRLAYKNKEYKQMVENLINLGANPQMHTKDYMKSFHEAV